MSEVPNKSPEPETTEKATIQGRHITLESGAEVWGGFHENSVYWRFTSVGGAHTDIRLSIAAMKAMIQVYQGLLGCDIDFLSVNLEPPEGVTP